MVKNMNIYDAGVLFKGYVLTQNKKCIEKFKGKTDFKTFEEVERLPEFAGILAEDTVLIDVDDQEESDKLFEIVKGEKINCVVIQTTRGKHFYFKNHDDLFSSNRTHATLAVGITADIKIGKRNSYSVLKFDHKIRKVLLTPSEVGTVPVWLQGISGKPNFNLSEGDGRNQALFNYILTLQSQSMSIEEIRSTIRLINEYILKEPLTEDELEVIIRDEAFKKQSFFKGTKFLHDKFAAFLKNNSHVIRNDGSILIYCEGVYEHSPREIEKAMTKEIPSLKKAQRNEVLSQLDLICEDVSSSSCELVAFRNGVLDVKTGELLPFSPAYIITNKIPWDYNKNAYDELVDLTLNKICCNDEEIRSILEEMIGACFYRSNTLAGGKAFILTGEGANGKSTFLNMLKAALGKDNYSSLDMKELNDRFSTVRMFKKLANIGDDISDEFNSDVSVFKKIVTGETIEAEQKGQPKFQFDPYCKLIFSANNIPRIKDKTGAAQRRILIVPFNAKFTSSDSDYDPQIFQKLQQQEAMEYFIALGVHGLQRVLKEKQFTSSAKVQQELEEYAEKNNPVLSFIKDCEENDFKVMDEPVNLVFKKYQEFCINSGFTALAMTEFSKQMQRLTGLKTKRKVINDKKYTIFVEE